MRQGFSLPARCGGLFDSRIENEQHSQTGDRRPHRHGEEFGVVQFPIHRGPLGNGSGDLAADDDADADGDEVEEALRAGADVAARFFIHNHEGDKNKTTEAEAVHRDAEDDGRQADGLGEGCRIGEEEHAQRVGDEADGEQCFARNAFGKKRDGHQHRHLRHLSDGHQSTATHADDFVHGLDKTLRLILELTEKGRGVDEIKLVDATHRHGEQEEREQWLALDLAESLADGALLFALRRWRGRQEETEHAHHDAEDAGELEGVRHAGELRLLNHLRRRDIHGRVPVQQPLADANAHGDPAHRAPNAHAAEVAVAIGQMMEGERIGQRERRRINDGVRETETQQTAVGADLRQLPHEHAADDVADGEELFRGKITVGNLPGDERRDDGAERAHRKNIAHLRGCQPAMPREKGPEQRQPRAPDGVLQKHHERKFGVQTCIERWWSE